MASNISCKILSILLLFVLLWSHSLATKDADKNSDENDFAEFETEDDEESDDAYEDEMETRPIEKNRARDVSVGDDDSDDDVDVETGRCFSLVGFPWLVVGPFACCVCCRKNA